MLYLLKELDDQSLAAACEKEWNSAAELYHRVAVHMEDLHHAVLLGKGEDANTVGNGVLKITILRFEPGSCA